MPKGSPDATRTQQADDAKGQLTGGELLSRVVLGQQLQQMPIRIAKVDSEPAVPMIDLHVVWGPWVAAVDQIFSLDTAEDLVEFCLTHFEGVVVWLE
jgi:hypothetical protein